MSQSPIPKFFHSSYSLISKSTIYPKHHIHPFLFSPHNPNHNPQNNLSNIKAKKSLLYNKPIFNIKYSTHHPNILLTCDQDGFISIINVDQDPLTSSSLYSQTASNNSNQIHPIFLTQLHNNAIYGIDWCSNDSKILSGSADLQCKMTNITTDHLGQNELIFLGHSRGIKCVTQSIFNDNIVASCGRDGLVFIWDKRVRNEVHCGKYCRDDEQMENHIHPIGAFRNVNKNSSLIKKKNFNEELPNAFTAVDFFTENLVISTEANSDDVKYWDMRNMIDNELELFLSENGINNKKISKKYLNLLEMKNFIAGINPHTYIYSKYLKMKEKHLLSSKYNMNNSLFFGLGTSLNYTLLSSIESSSLLLSGVSNHNTINGTLDNFAIAKTKKNKVIQEKPIIESCHNKNTIKYLNGFNYKETKIAEKDMNIDSNNNNEEKEKEIEEINQLQMKIKEIKNKKTKKGLTSLNINRIQRKILVNSMSNTQYVYDALFIDNYQPIELKGHVSTYFVKSVLSPDGQYVLSGSGSVKTSNSNPLFLLYLWDINKTDQITFANYTPLKLDGYHQREINAVDWGRNHTNYIASACDSGLILLWDF